MIILSIPCLNNDFVVEKAEEYPDYWKEFRLDYSQNLDLFPIEIIDDKTIITIRSKTEGGINYFDPRNKVKFYKKMISQKNCLCDLEINEIDDHNISTIPAPNLILSYHDFSENCDSIALKKIVEKSNLYSSAYLKIAVNVNKYSDLVRISEVTSLSQRPVIFAGMGKLGKLSRILFRHLGAEATFIGLSDNPTALGQLTTQEAKFYKLRSITKKTKIGGIIGGDQVERSLGLKYYNDLFKQKKLDAAYLPFVTNDFGDLWKWVYKTDINFFGFSITMPFKKMIGKMQNIPIANLFLPKSDEMLNTDYTAFQRSTKYLRIKQENEILVFGSGATAETALLVLENFNNVILSSRKEFAGKELAKKYERKFIQLQYLDDLKIDLIINCTPIGMNGEDFINVTNIKKFKKVIDLPYQIVDTKLIEFCKKNEIPFVDGKQFWQWQAEKQQEEFLKEINK